MEDPKTCSKCGSPVTPGMKFCESCGAKVEALPACTTCGAALATGVKFCESCGAAIAPAAVPVIPIKEEAVVVDAPAPPVPEPVPDQKAPSRSRPPVTEILVEDPTDTPSDSAVISPTPTNAPVQKTRPASKSVEKQKAAEANMLSTEAAPAPLPAMEPDPASKLPTPAEGTGKDVPIEVATVAAAVETWTRAETGSGESGVPKDNKSKRSIPAATLIIGGVLVLALLAAGVYFVGLPLLSAPGTPVQPPTVFPGTPSSGIPQTSPVTPAGTSQTGSVSLTAGPTQVLPANRGLIIDVERDAITHMITVTFQGGSGQYGVRELVVTLTKSDGTVETKSFKPEYRGTSIALKGTEKTDRVEITANFFNGETYKVVDQVFEYKKRVGSF